MTLPPLSFGCKEMTYTPTRYRTYADYLNADLGPDGNFRLLSNGEAIELPPEDEENICIGSELTFLLKQRVTPRRLVRAASTEIQVHPVGDSRVNRIHSPTFPTLTLTATKVLAGGI